MPSEKPPYVASDAFLTEIEGFVEASATLSPQTLMDAAVRRYVQASRGSLLRRWFEKWPSAVAFSNGRSVLMTLFERSPEMALEWWEMRGAEAWAPTAADPFPLTSILKGLLHFSSFDSDRTDGLRFVWPLASRQDLNGTVKARMAAFIQDGLRHAMPLRLDAPKACVQAAEIKAQADVVAFLSEPCSLFGVAEKFPWLQSHRGALAMNSNGDYLHLIGIAAVTPKTPVWVHQDMRVFHRPLATTWKTNAQLPHAEHVLPWLEGHGVDTDRERGQVLKHALHNVSEWDRVQTLVDALPGGWERSWTDQPFIPWQGTLQRRPRFLNELLNMPHAAERVALFSPSGHGIWDALAAGMSSLKRPGDDTRWGARPELQQKSLLELARLTPLRLRLSETPGLEVEGPWAFRLHHVLPNWWPAFCRKSLKNPGAAIAWFGPPDSTQAVRAGVLAVRLLVKQATNARQRECVAMQIEMLHAARRARPRNFAPDVGAVLWFVQALIREGNIGLKRDLSAFLNEPFPEPSLDHLGWVEEVRRCIPYPTRPHASLALFQGLATKARLRASLPVSNAPRRVSPRL